MLHLSSRYHLVPLLALLGMSGCTPTTPPGGGWQRVDLSVEPPRVEVMHGDEEGAEPFEQRIGLLGTAEVRDLERIGPQRVNLPAKMIRVLEQRAGSRLAWSLELGEAPRFSFTPVGTRRTRCACRYAVAVRDGDGTLTPLLRVAADPVRDPAPGRIDVDLGPWAGETVDLLLSVEAPGGVTVQHDRPIAADWGSPVVTHRVRRVPSRRSAERPNVLLVGIDTLRAEALGVYGTRQPSVSPALDRFAQECDVWLDAFSTFNNTNPSFISIHTGLYGKNHGVYDLVTPLPEEHTTLAEVFSEGGYDTLAVLAARHLRPRTSGLGQGFGEVIGAPRQFGAELVVDEAMRWIDAHGERPFFAWVHLFDPHTPHAAPLPYAAGLRPEQPTGWQPVDGWIPFRPIGLHPYREARLGGHHELYGGEVAYMDRQLDRLFAYLADRGLLESTVVAIVADHGENLGEHGQYTSHNGLWDTTTHVPLMIRWPGAERRGRRLEGLVQTLDLFPTLLEAARLPVPEQDGIPLDELTGEGRSGRRAVFTEHANYMGIAVRTREHRYYESVDNFRIPDGRYLYDIEADPDETESITDEQPAVAGELAAAVERWIAARRTGDHPAPRDLSPEEAERLKALGYVR